MKWKSVKESPPPFNVEVLACNEDFPNMWVAERWIDSRGEFFTPTIFPSGNAELHNFNATHWKYLPKGPNDDSMD